MGKKRPKMTKKTEKTPCPNILSDNRKYVSGESKVMVTSVAHEIGDVVFLITDIEQEPRMVTAITVRANGITDYQLSCGTLATWHYSIEISSERAIK